MTATYSPTNPHTEPRSSRYTAGMAKRVLRGIADIRLHLRDVFAGVDAGEHVVLSRRGRPVAALVPIEWYRIATGAMGDPTEY